MLEVQNLSAGYGDAVALDEVSLVVPDRRIVAVFQPHRYTRTRDLLTDFARAFNDAELVVVSDIYAAGEDPIPGISSAALAQALRDHGHRGVQYIGRRADVARALRPMLRSGDIVITLGAGDIWQSGEDLLALLQQ